MSRNDKVTFVKPRLEQLEDRAVPAVLLFGNGVQQLAQPLTNIVNDMQSASTDLQAQFNLIKNVQAPANTFAGAEVTANKAVADWQRILTDTAAVNSIVNADTTFIHAVAFSEFQAGDPVDLIILTFGQFFGLNPTKQLTDLSDQALKVLHDPTLLNIVNTNLHSLNTFVDSTTPIAQETFPVTF